MALAGVLAYPVVQIVTAWLAADLMIVLSLQPVPRFPVVPTVLAVKVPLDN